MLSSDSGCIKGTTQADVQLSTLRDYSNIRSKPTAGPESSPSTVTRLPQLLRAPCSVLCALCAGQRRRRRPGEVDEPPHRPPSFLARLFSEGGRVKAHTGRTHFSSTQDLRLRGEEVPLPETYRVHHRRSCIRAPWSSHQGAASQFPLP